ncbi:MAG: hypothetical protein VXZ78_01160, partial [Pseudomonadota bacterium]|nr:hypothetical protein [Pseudomonadota bacterium]
YIAVHKTIRDILHFKFALRARANLDPMGKACTIFPGQTAVAGGTSLVAFLFQWLQWIVNVTNFRRLLIRIPKFKLGSEFEAHLGQQGFIVARPLLQHNLGGKGIFWHSLLLTRPRNRIPPKHDGGRRVVSVRANHREPKKEHNQTVHVPVPMHQQLLRLQILNKFKAAYQE